jgi:hypothetical protein
MAGDDLKTLAAVVFKAEADKINDVMAAFAAARAAQGLRLAGVVQVSAHTQGCACSETHVLDLESGARIPILQDLGSQSEACRADSAALADVAEILRRALARGPDLILINRFGRLEAEGKGLRAEIGAAAASGIPVLVGVSLRYLEAWRAFTSGLDVELACTSAALEDWWHRLEQARISAASLPEG